VHSVRQALPRGDVTSVTLAPVGDGARSPLMPDGAGRRRPREQPPSSSGSTPDSFRPRASPWSLADDIAGSIGTVAEKAVVTNGRRGSSGAEPTCSQALLGSAMAEPQGRWSRA
jgi:hypothetical protein